MEVQNMHKIFCLPYAGGSSTMYFKLRKKLEVQYKVIPVEYSGHGYRMDEKLISDVSACIDDVYGFINENCSNDDFSILGYSLGGAIAYEVAKKIVNEGRSSKLLKSLVICSCAAPNYPETIQEFDSLSDHDFIKYLIRLGGTTINSREEERALRFFLPIVKSDFNLYNKYKSLALDSVPVKIDIPISVFYSCDEKKKIELWDHFSSYPVTYKYFNGGHFFINEQCESLASSILEVLNKVHLV